jgi:hypothetical protein
MIPPPLKETFGNSIALALFDTAFGHVLFYTTQYDNN